MRWIASMAAATASAFGFGQRRVLGRRWKNSSACGSAASRAGVSPEGLGLSGLKAASSAAIVGERSTLARPELYLGFGIDGNTVAGGRAVTPAAHGAQDGGIVAAASTFEDKGTVDAA